MIVTASMTPHFDIYTLLKDLKRPLLLCLILCCNSISLKAQETQDSLLYFDEIEYHSEFEKESFKAFFKENKGNYLALFLATSPSVNADQYNKYKNIYDSHIRDINTEKLGKKKAQKKIKSVYEEVHAKFLKKYEAQNSMNAIFLNGSYNCVSASALYSLVFNELEIPYSIKEKPTHVYVVAYPESERILVESTDPSGGFIAFGDKYKQAYIEQMAKAKIISVSETNTKSTNELFDEYFFSDNDIDLRQLIGIQYINEALYLLAEAKNEEALLHLEKAYFFSQDEKVSTLILAVNAEILSSSNYENLALADNFISLTRFKSYGITNNDILGEFARVSQAHLVDQYNPDFFDQFYNKILEGIQDNELELELSYLYSYERGRVLYNMGKYHESLDFFEKAYKLKPKNTEMSRLFVNTLALRLNNESNNNKVVEILESYKKELTELNENNIFKSMLVNSYLIEFGQSFELGKEKKALRYKSLFEENFNSELTIFQQNIGRAYSLAAIYYFKKGYTSKARTIINKGLEIAPGNHELLSRKRLIN